MLCKYYLTGINHNQCVVAIIESILFFIGKTHKNIIKIQFNRQRRWTMRDRRCSINFEGWLRVRSNLNVLVISTLPNIWYNEVLLFMSKRKEKWGRLLPTGKLKILILYSMDIIKSFIIYTYGYVCTIINN